MTDNKLKLTPKAKLFNLILCLKAPNWLSAGSQNFLYATGNTQDRTTFWSKIDFFFNLNLNNKDPLDKHETKSDYIGTFDFMNFLLSS